MYLCIIRYHLKFDNYFRERESNFSIKIALEKIAPTKINIFTKWISFVVQQHFLILFLFFYGSLSLKMILGWLGGIPQIFLSLGLPQIPPTSCTRLPVSLITLSHFNSFFCCCKNTSFTWI